VCDTATGSCSNPAKPDNTICSDGNACTTVDKCSAGTCTGGAIDPCDDSIACTIDSCDPSTGCFSDGSACPNEICDNGQDEDGNGKTDCEDPDCLTFFEGYLKVASDHTGDKAKYLYGTLLESNPTTTTLVAGSQFTLGLYCQDFLGTDGKVHPIAVSVSGNQGQTQGWTSVFGWKFKFCSPWTSGPTRGQICADAQNVENFEKKTSFHIQIWPFVKPPPAPPQ
ncbi:MAG: hypothetical protein AAB373_00865, partial [Patescibacteria group bacterium]